MLGNLNRFKGAWALLLLCWCFVVQAQSKVVHVAFGTDRIPYLFGQDAGQGLEIEIVAHAFELEGYQLVAKQLPHLLLKTALIDDPGLDGVAGWQADTVSGQYISDIYINYENYVFSRTADNFDIHSLDGLKGKSIAVWSDGYQQLGKGFYALFNPKARGVNASAFYEANDQANLMNLFFSGDVDLVVADKTAFQWYANQLIPGSFSEDDFVLHDVLPQVTGYNLLLRDRELRDVFNRGLHKMISSGEYQQLIDYYLSTKGVTIVRQLQREGAEEEGLALTQDEKRWLRLNPIVNFTGDANWLPFEGLDEQGSYVGIVADFLTHIEQQTGIHFTKSFGEDWDASLAMALDGRADIISAGHSNLKLREGFTPVEPYISNPIVIVKTEKDSFVDSLTDIEDNRIAVVRNASFVPRVRQLYPEHNFIGVESVVQGLEGVSTGQYDAMLGTMAMVNHTIGELGSYNLRIVGKTGLDTRLTLFVRNDKPKLHSIINKVLLNVEGSLRQEIFNRWIKQRYVERPNYELIATIVVVSLIIVGIFLYWNRRLSEEVRLRMATEAELKIAKERAESATQAKSAFLSNMSHEIRTPMNAIVGFTELLSEGITDKQHQGFIKTIQSAGNSLLTLINDILDLSKIEAGKLDIHKVATNPHALFDDVGKLFMVELDKKQLDFLYDIDKDIPRSLMIDTARLRQILFNLIGNAVKFTDKGYVRLKARQQPCEDDAQLVDLLITVEDTGVGIATQDLAHVFGAFDQSRYQDNQKYGGTGLGLAISQRLAGLMDGHISVTSKLGSGTRFELVLHRVEVSAHVVTQNKEDKVADQTSVQFKPAVVLIVDDVEINRLLVQECFSGTPLDFLSAGSGPEALAILEQQPVDLILMDIRMPGMDGYEAAEKAKLIQDKPVIALTATVMDPLDQSFIDSPFDAYLKKPVFKKELFESLQAFLPFESKIACASAADKPMEVKFNDMSIVDSKAILALLDEQLLPQWQAIRASNKVSEIKKFAEIIEQMGEDYQIRACKDYARVLKETVDAYDIVGIKNSVKNFPVLSGLIKKTLERG